MHVIFLLVRSRRSVLDVMSLFGRHGVFKMKRNEMERKRNNMKLPKLRAIPKQKIFTLSVGTFDEFPRKGGEDCDFAFARSGGGEGLNPNNPN